MVSGDVDRSAGGIWRSKWPSERNHLTIGDPANGGAASHRTDAVKGLFTSTEVPVRIEVASDIRSRIFDKLLINASMNTISTLTRTDCGQVIGDPQLQALLRHLILEVEGVHTGTLSLLPIARSLSERVLVITGVAAALDPPPSLGWTADAIVEMYTAQFGLRTSMLQDLLAERELGKYTILQLLVMHRPVLTDFV